MFAQKVIVVRLEWWNTLDYHGWLQMLMGLLS